MIFSDTINNQGILQQTRSLTRLDANQWPTSKVVASSNNWLDFVAGYMIGNDKRFQWDDTNHTKLPEGTTDLEANQSDYSFLTDEQGNKILTLLGVSVLENGKYTPLTLIDRNDPDIDLGTFGVTTGTPTKYDKISDNIIRLDFKPSATVSTGLKFYFQRTPSYFEATDTTKEPGVPQTLHRGFVIASAYDAALTLGLKNFQALSGEREYERQNVINYFASRNNDLKSRMTPNNNGINSCR